MSYSLPCHHESDLSPMLNFPGQFFKFVTVAKQVFYILHSIVCTPFANKLLSPNLYCLSVQLFTALQTNHHCLLVIHKLIWQENLFLLHLHLLHPCCVYDFITISYSMVTKVRAVLNWGVQAFSPSDCFPSEMCGLVA